MLYRIILCALLAVVYTFPSYAQTEHLSVKYLNAQDIVGMARSSGKPYLLVAIYVPKCANAPELFRERAGYYNKKKDKLDLIMLSILYSPSNADTVAKLSKYNNFDKPFYAMDTIYTKGELRDTPVKFMKDLNRTLGVAHEPFQYILIDKNGRLIFRDDGNLDVRKLDRFIK